MMKKTLLTLATVVTASVLSMAADCSGSNVVKCTVETDCAETEICAIAEADTEGTCVTPICAEDTDCDIQDTGDGSPIADVADFEGTCEAEDYVTIVGFDGNEYCAVEETAEFSCADDLDGADVSVTAALKAGGTVKVCVLADGTFDFDGTCS